MAITFAQYYVIFLLLSFLILILPTIIIEAFPEEMAPAKEAMARVRETLLIKILGYSEEAAKFPVLIFSVIIPFGIALGVTLIFMSWLQRNIFPQVSEGLFAILAWFMALIVTRLYGPVIGGWYAGLTLYGMVAFGGALLISFLLTTKIYKMGFWGVIMVGAITLVISLVSLSIFHFLGLVAFPFPLIWSMSLGGAAFMTLFSILMMRKTLSATEALIKATEARIRSLQYELNKCLEKLKEEEDLETIAKLQERIKKLKAKISYLEKQQIKALAGSV